MASTLADKRLRRYLPEEKNFGKPRLYVYPRVGIAEGYKTSHGVDAGGQAVKALLAGEKKFVKPCLYFSPRVGIAEGYKTSHGVDAGGQAVKVLLAGEKKFRKTPPLCISTRRYRRGLQDVPWRRRWRTSG